MRTQDEIVERIKKREKDDLFGFETSCYINFLDYEHAKPYLKPDVTENDWHKSDKSPKEEMIDYMEFAWDKAKGCRGISAGRSIMHYEAWLWLDGAENLFEDIEDYQYYGKDILVDICKYLGLDPEKWDDHIRVNSESELPD